MATFKGTNNNNNVGNSNNNNNNIGILKTSNSYKRAQSALPGKRRDTPSANDLAKFSINNNGNNINNNLKIEKSNSSGNLLTKTSNNNSLRRSSSAKIVRPYSAMPVSKRNLKEALEFAGSPQQLQGAAMSLTRKIRSRGRPKTAMMLSGLSLRTRHRDVRERVKINHGSGWK